MSKDCSQYLHKNTLIIGLNIIVVEQKHGEKYFNNFSKVQVYQPV